MGVAHQAEVQLCIDGLARLEVEDGQARICTNLAAGVVVQVLIEVWVRIAALVAALCRMHGKSAVTAMHRTDSRAENTHPGLRLEMLGSAAVCEPSNNCSHRRPGQGTGKGSHRGVFEAGQLRALQGPGLVLRPGSLQQPCK